MTFIAKINLLFIPSFSIDKLELAVLMPLCQTLPLPRQYPDNALKIQQIVSY